MKKIKFKIALRLGAAFSLIALIFIGSYYFTFKNVTNAQNKSTLLLKTYSPSSKYIEDLLFLLNTYKMQLERYKETENEELKNQLNTIYTQQYPQINDSLVSYYPHWKNTEKNLYKQISRTNDSLFYFHIKVFNVEEVKTKEIHKEEELFNDFDFTDSTQINDNIAITDSLLKDSIEDDANLDLDFWQNVDEKSNTEIDKMISITKLNIDNTTQLKDSLNLHLTKYENEVNKSYSDLKQNIVFNTFLIIILVFIISVVMIRALVVPIKRIKKRIQMMSQGILPKKKLKVRSDEIGEMAKALNQLVNGLEDTSKFSIEIGKGNYSSGFKPMSEKDVLGTSLIKMQESLKNADEERKIREEEDRQRSWATQGIAIFSEIVRKSNDDLEELSYTVISEIVKYLDANQGGLFIINDEDKENVYIELSAAYAYERRKYLEKKIEIGVGIVGQCVKEGETIYMTDIPSNYMKITSGLGDENPTSLLVVPLKLNEQIFGVLEIASFYELKKYQIDFVEKIGETIASTISNVKISNNTAKLLKESQEISEQMAQQEEEMRQTIEEMRAQQEEMTQRQKDEHEKEVKIKEEYKTQIKELQQKYNKQQDDYERLLIDHQNITNAINATVGIIEYNMDGVLLEANKRFLKNARIQLEIIKGKNHSEIVSTDHHSSEEYHQFWESLNKGKIQNKIFVYDFAEKLKWFNETFTPVKDKTDNLTKIIVISYDITTHIKEQNDLKKLLQEANIEIERLSINKDS